MKIERCKQVLALWMSALLLMSTVPAAAEVYERVYSVEEHRYVYVPRETTGSKIKRFFRKPVVKKMTVGTAGGVGLAAVTGHSLVKGGVAGAATGLGVHAVDKSHTMQRKPLARRALKGGIIGTGIGVAAGAALLPAVAVGAGVGAAYHYIKDDP